MIEEQQVTFTTLLDYVQVVWKNKWYVLLITILGGSVSIFIALELPDVYESFTLILIERQKVPEDIVKSAVTGNVGSRVATIKQQILSRTNIKKIIRDFKIKPVEDVANSLFSSLKKRLKVELKQKISMITGRPFENIRGDAQQKDLLKEERLIGLILKNISIETHGRGQNIQSFKVTYRGREPVWVMNIANRLASVFIEENLKLREMMVEGTSEFLENELFIQKKILEEKEAAISKFKQRYMGSLPGQLHANLQTLGRFQTALASVRESLVKANEGKYLLEESMIQLEKSMRIRQDAARELKASQTALEAAGLRGSSEDGALDIPPPLGLVIRTTKAQLARLLVEYKDTYPDVILLKNNIRKLEEQLESERAASVEKELLMGEAAGLGKNENAAEDEGKVEFSPETAMNIEDLEITEGLMRLKESYASYLFDIKVMKKREKNIIEKIKIYQKRVDNTPMREQDLAILQRDYGNITTHYATLLSKQLTSKISENLEKRQKGEQFRVIDSAFLPISPISPDRQLIIMAGFLLSFGIGAGIFIIFDFFVKPFRRPEDLLGLADVSFIVTIPLADSKSRKANGGGK